MTQKNPLKIDYDHFELVVLYNALTDEQYLSSIIDVVKSSYFKNKDIQLIIDIIANFYQRRNVLPTITEIKTYLTTEELKNSFRTLLLSFKTLDTNINKDELLENTERFFKEKAVHEAVITTVNDYSNNKIDIGATLDIFEKACNLSLVDDLGHNYFKEIDKHCNELQTTYKYISSGWKWLDNKIAGGYLASGRALYVFSGFTNVGKSLFLGNTGVNILKQDKTVVIISLEMSETVYSARISSQLAKLPTTTLSTSTNQLKTNVSSFRSQHPNASLIIKEFPPKTITCNHIRAYLKKLISKGIKPDIVIVDYINLINPPIVTGSSYTDIKAVTEQLRALTYIFGVPIISATQLGRAGANAPNPGMELVSESIGLSFTVDAQFSIWQNEGDTELGVIHLGIQKNRFGQNHGSTTLKIDYSTLSIDEIEDQYISSNKSITDAASSLDNLITG